MRQATACGRRRDHRLTGRRRSRDRHGRGARGLNQNTCGRLATILLTAGGRSRRTAPAALTGSSPNPSIANTLNLVWSSATSTAGALSILLVVRDEGRVSQLIQRDDEVIVIERAQSGVDCPYRDELNLGDVPAQGVEDGRREFWSRAIRICSTATIIRQRVLRLTVGAGAQGRGPPQALIRPRPGRARRSGRARSPSMRAPPRCES